MVTAFKAAAKAAAAKEAAEAGERKRHVHAHDSAPSKAELPAATKAAFDKAAAEEAADYFRFLKKEKEAVLDMWRSWDETSRGDF